MTLRKTLKQLGSIARVQDLIARGHTSDQLRQAVRTGVLIRPRRGWVALPGADPVRLSAVECGVVLTCITQAKRLGLWVLEHPEAHVASRTPSTKTQVVSGVLHRAAVPVPREPGAIEDHIENVLWLVASCQPFESALAIWDSALNRRLVSWEALAQLPLKAKARRVLDMSSPYADSGLESIVRSRLRWLRISIRPQVMLLGHRVDLLLGERLVVQIDGGHHVGAQRHSDIRHDAQLLTSGYHVIRIGYGQVLREWPETQTLIMQAVARGLHRSPSSA